MPGVKVTDQQVQQGLKGKDKPAIFPGYSADDANLGTFITITPPNSCDSPVEILYDTNFAIAASTISKREELINLAKGLITLVGDLPSSNAIINGVNLVATGIDAAIDKKAASGSYEFKVTPEVCTPPQYVSVTCEVIGSSLVLDADPDDKAERAQFTIVLSALGETKTDTFPNDKKFDVPVPVIGRVTVGPRCVNAVTAYAKLDIACTTDGRSFGRSSTSIMKIDAVKITFTAQPCPPDGRTSTPPRESGTVRPREPRKPRSDAKPPQKKG